MYESLLRKPPQATNQSGSGLQLKRNRTRLFTTDSPRRWAVYSWPEGQERREWSQSTKVV